ncbi:MAG: Helix-hairpin-helix motif protein [Planctomycetes bacterium ADurb.Bin412]|nr:MAG: Helix-hairpin-helix motif protein [Planctomycetes bacterium ADurb.Bin412]
MEVLVSALSPRPVRRRAAMALVLVLWVLVILTVLIVAMAQNTRLENAIRMAAGDRVTARWAARAGIHQGLGLLRQDGGTTDGLYDSWYENPGRFQEVPLFSASFTVLADRFKLNHEFSYGLEDEAAKVNLNTAGREAILALPEMNETIVAAILAWRNTRRVSGGETDSPTIQTIVESALQIPSLTSFLTIREAGLLPEVNRKILYGEDTNRNGVLDTNENDGDRMDPPDNEDGRLDRGLLAYVTVYSYDWNRDGRGRRRININTAPLAVLETELELSYPHALWILENRVVKMKSIASLLMVDKAPEQGTGLAGGSEEAEPLDLQTFRRIADRITVTDEDRIPGRININTAGKAVLQTLPGITEPLAINIVEARTALSEGYTSIAELLLVPGITIDLFMDIAELITVRSNVFTIRSCGRAERTGIQHTVEAVVDRGQDPPMVLYWKECDY